MSFRNLIISMVVGFTGFCGLLVWQSGLFENKSAEVGCITLQKSSQQEPAAPEAPADTAVAELKSVYVPHLGADNSSVQSIILGANDPNKENPEKGFKFQLKLSSKGGAIESVTFSNGENKGFVSHDTKNRQPLTILSPVDNQAVYSMSISGLIFPEYKILLPLDQLHWANDGVRTLEDGSEVTAFYATIKDRDSGEDVLRVSRTYKVTAGSYIIDCDVRLENLSPSEQKVRFNIRGPVGIGMEDVRSDDRKVVGGFSNIEGKTTSVRLDVKHLSKANTLEKRRLVKDSDRFLWAAAVNKYFAAIVVPVPQEGENFATWVQNKYADYYDPDGLANSGDEAVGIELQTADTTLEAKGSAAEAKDYGFRVYLGSKDKREFVKGQYKGLGFVETIDFMPCFCCPAAVINPLAFGILATMEWMYKFIPNYGVVIIILVLLIRIVLHPITKKSQISMTKMTKLGPMAEEIKKKYASNKQEMQKQLMSLYKEQGASPIMGFLPMLLQMPIWIALYSAISASVALRGAKFLPFWITDLSAPDALVTFTTITIPYLKWHISEFNLLPILMGVAMYFQQKMMPGTASSASSVTSNPQLEQQQKMMKIMMPFLFPVMLYNAPSGLNLYIMASTFAGVIEQHVIRRHIEEKEAAEAKGFVPVTSKTGGKVKKKKPKPFFKRF